MEVRLSPTDRYRVELRDAELGDGDIETRWQRLAIESGRATCFALPAYFRAWRRTLADGVETHLLTVLEGDELVGIMPIMRALVWRGPSCVPRHDYAPADRTLITDRRPRPFPVRQISPVVSMPATMVGPVPLCRPGLEATVTHAMARTLIQLPRWDVIVLPCFEGVEQDSWLSAFEALRLKPWILVLDRFIQSIGHVRPLAEIVAGHRKKFRQNVRRARAAAEGFALEFTTHEGRDAVCRMFATLERVAKASWKHEGRRSAGLRLCYEGRQQMFFEHLLADPDLGALPILLVAADKHDAIGCLLALRHGDTVTALLIFRDESYPTASPGLLLLGQLIDWCAERGVKHLDLNATHEWVRHLADHTRSMNNLVLFAPTLTGRAYSLVSKAAQWRRQR